VGAAGGWGGRVLMVHGAWVDRRLAVWAEDSRSSAPAATGRRVHPFAAPTSALAAALRPTVTGASAAELTIQLPGSATRPVPSPESGIPHAVRRPRLGTWRVPALLLDPAGALSFLDPLDRTDSLNNAFEGALDAGEATAADEATAVEAAGAGPEWGPAASLRYLGVVGALARDLVRRGRILPQLVTEDGVPAARWTPVLTGPDEAEFHSLAAAMPPVCRAVSDGRPAADVLTDALAGLVDRAARQVLPDRLLAGRPAGPRHPLADRWLFALTGDDAVLPSARPAEVAALGDVLRGWLASAYQLQGPVRVCFQLREPARDADSWIVEFGLQPADEPDHYVPASRIWAGEAVPGLPQRPDELLLAGLGRAARLCPDLYPALQQARPAGLAVDAAWAYTFLRQGAPLLRAAGYGVRLPAWSGRQSLGLRLATRSHGDRLDLDDRVDVSLGLAIGDHPVTEAQLAELADLDVPLVRLGSQWVELDGRQLTSALKALEERRGADMTVGDVIREVTGGGDDDLPLVDIDADGLLGDLLSGEADRRLAPVSTPDSFDGTLRPYQERGLSWLSFLSGLGLGGILADDMGLGKTAQTLSLLLIERTGGTPRRPTLLVCPMSLVSNWQKEASRFAPSLRVYVHHGATRKRGEELAEAVRRADLVLTTYGTAVRDLDALATLHWGRIVCDEAQAIKNNDTHQARAVRAIPARTRLALTGTPVENHLGELWSIMDFCNPGLLGSARRFRERYREPIEIGRDERAAQALRRATGPFILRRLKTDKSIISDLPEKLEMKTWCSLTPEQAQLYTAVLNDMMGRIENTEGIARRGNVLATMTRLKQVCNHPAHLLKDGSRLAGRSGKLARLEELAQEIVEEGDKALVFTQYAEFGALLQPYLAAHLDRPVLWLHGGLSKARRDELVDRFQTDDEPMLFLLSLKAAGTGLNLTAGNHVIHGDRWWNPAVEDQATDRAFRIGQRRNVQVRKFICVDTLEERIDDMIEQKKALAERVVGAGEDWITDLSTEALRELFRLGPGAVS
jgi:superfamily II DNA or RNA helicase